MDRLVSAYRNKLECRQGKEYYYKVGETSIYAVSLSHMNHDSFLKVSKTWRNHLFSATWSKSCSELQKGRRTQLWEREVICNMWVLWNQLNGQNQQRYKEIQQMHQDCHTEVTDWLSFIVQLNIWTFLRLNIWTFLQLNFWTFLQLNIWTFLRWNRLFGSLCSMCSLTQQEIPIGNRSLRWSNKEAHLLIAFSRCAPCAASHTTISSTLKILISRRRKCWNSLDYERFRCFWLYEIWAAFSTIFRPSHLSA